MGGLIVLPLGACASPGNCSKVVPPVPIRQSGPQVPAGFWDQHEDGVVQLRLQIGNEGSVIDPRVVSSPGHDYSVIALDAVKKWRYEPALCDGRPISTELTVTMRFAH